MLKLGRRISLIGDAVPVVITVAVVGLCFLTAGAYVAVTYKRGAVETKLGSRPILNGQLAYRGAQDPFKRSA